MARSEWAVSSSSRTLHRYLSTFAWEDKSVYVLLMRRSMSLGRMEVDEDRTRQPCSVRLEEEYTPRDGVDRGLSSAAALIVLFSSLSSHS